MTQIKYAVGEGGLNEKIECAYIQILLNKKLAQNPSFPKISEDGICKTQTIKAIRAFQTQAKLYHADGRVDPGKRTFIMLTSGFSPAELTACWNQAVMKQNKGLIIDEQAKRAQATNKPLPKKLVSARPDVLLPGNTNGFSFPLARWPEQNYLNYEGRAFGADRTGKRGQRFHAGLDLIMPAGTPIYAIADGKVRHDPTYFYFGTYVLEVTHGEYIVRYGEIFPSAATGVKLAESVLPDIKKGKEVKKGQIIAYVGRFYDPYQNKSLSMLHFEMFANPQLDTNLSDTSPGCTPYKRRKDLIDPTRLLNAARSSLPSGGDDLAPKLTQELAIFAKAQAIRLGK
ncbi:MAG TPA: M23 family metallopeptidase [Cellvibrio sp.]|nr:M23 family metallopeptidase [Cellvibrio sp.]